MPRAIRRPFASARFVADFGRVALLAAIYFAVAKLALLAAIPPGYATAVWPPSGLALAALLLFGRHLWPGVFLGATLVNVGVQSSPVAALLMGAGNTLEGLTGALLIEHYLGVPRTFARGRDILTFVLAACASAVVAATVAAVPLSLLHRLELPELYWNWWTWWQGDVMGIILVTPLLLSWSAGEPAPRAGESTALGICMLLVTGFLFGGSAPLLPLTFVVLPIIVWAAVRFGQREVTTLVAGVCAIAVYFTATGRGPFATDGLNMSMLLLLAFMSTVAVTGLVLNAIVRERGRTLVSLAETTQQLRELAITDALTGLYNRRFVHEYLARELALAGRRGVPLAFLMIDLDHFKRVNDLAGHDVGDAVLRTVAALLKSSIRASDIACRYGGEEFLLILQDTALEAARSKAEDVRARFERATGALHGTTASIGVALFPQHGMSADTLASAADRALYEAKALGRNQVVVSSLRAQPG